MATTYVDGNKIKNVWADTSKIKRIWVDNSLVYQYVEPVIWVGTTAKLRAIWNDHSSGVANTLSLSNFETSNGNCFSRSGNIIKNISGKTLTLKVTKGGFAGTSLFGWININGSNECLGSNGWTFSSSSERTGWTFTLPNNGTLNLGANVDGTQTISVYCDIQVIAES